MLRVPNAFVNPPGVVLLNGEEHRVEAGDHYRDELDDFCAAIRGEHPALIGRVRCAGRHACSTRCYAVRARTDGVATRIAAITTDPTAAIQSVVLVPSPAASGPAIARPTGWNAIEPNQS